MTELKYNFDDNLNLLRTASSDLGVLKSKLSEEFESYEGFMPANPVQILQQIAALQGRIDEVRFCHDRRYTRPIAMRFPTLRRRAGRNGRGRANHKGNFPSTQAHVTSPNGHDAPTRSHAVGT